MSGRLRGRRKGSSEPPFTLLIPDGTNHGNVGINVLARIWAADANTDLHFCLAREKTIFFCSQLMGWLFTFALRGVGLWRAQIFAPHGRHFLRCPTWPGHQTPGPGRFHSPAAHSSRLDGSPTRPGIQWGEAGSGGRRAWIAGAHARKFRWTALNRVRHGQRPLHRRKPRRFPRIRRRVGGGVFLTRHPPDGGLTPCWPCALR
jgi:hypothetical protein